MMLYSPDGRAAMLRAFLAVLALVLLALSSAGCELARIRQYQLGGNWRYTIDREGRGFVWRDCRWDDARNADAATGVTIPGIVPPCFVAAAN
jgi:hypothetical protein